MCHQPVFLWELSLTHPWEVPLPYIWDSGRVGSDGSPALSLLLKTKRVCTVNKSMIKYRDNVVFCRRDLLFQDMENYEHVDCAVIFVPVPVVHVVIKFNII